MRCTVRRLVAVAGAGGVMLLTMVFFSGFFGIGKRSSMLIR